MSRKEVPRAGLLKAALEGRISSAQGAVALRLSVRVGAQPKPSIALAVEGCGRQHEVNRGQPLRRRSSPCWARASAAARPRALPGSRSRRRSSAPPAGRCRSS